MQCYPSYAMYWTVLAAGNWTTGQVNCQGQLGSNIAAYHGKLGYIHTYIYKLYLRIISLIMKAPPSNIHSLKRNGRPRDAIQIIREMKHPELHWYINHNCFWNILKWSIFLVRLALSVSSEISYDFAGYQNRATFGFVGPPTPALSFSVSSLVLCGW